MSHLLETNTHTLRHDTHDAHDITDFRLSVIPAVFCLVFFHFWSFSNVVKDFLDSNYKDQSTGNNMHPVCICRPF